MCGADAASNKGDEGTVQIIAKYILVCKELTITPLSLREMAELRMETLREISKASLLLSKQPISNKGN